MIELIFEGFSDDTFGEVKHFRDDFDDCANSTRIQFLVHDPVMDEGIVVTGQHADGHDGGWSIGVATYDPKYEDRAIPEWEMHIKRGSSSYSPALHIIAPDSVVMKHLGEEEE